MGNRRSTKKPSQAGQLEFVFQNRGDLPDVKHEFASNVILLTRRSPAPLQSYKQALDSILGLARGLPRKIG